MKIVESDDGFEVHIESSVTRNIVNSNRGVSYVYYRLVIPNVLMSFFVDSVGAVEYLYFFFVSGCVVVSPVMVHGVKYFKRKIMRVGENSYAVNLSENALNKWGFSVGDVVCFVVSTDLLLDVGSNVCIELVL